MWLITHAMNQFPEYHFAIIRMNRYWIQINRSIVLLKTYILRYYENEMKKTEKKTDEEQYVKFYADYLSYGMLGLFHEWYTSKSEISLEELAQIWNKVSKLGEIM